MKNGKFLKAGAEEVVIILGVFKQEVKALRKELKKETEKRKSWKFNFDVIHDKATRIETLYAEEITQKNISIATLQEILTRASKGLSEDKKENTENLKPLEVKSILDKALEAWSVKKD